MIAAPNKNARLRAWTGRRAVFPWPPIAIFAHERFPEARRSPGPDRGDGDRDHDLRSRKRFPEPIPNIQATPPPARTPFRFVPAAPSRGPRLFPIGPAAPEFARCAIPACLIPRSPSDDRIRQFGRLRTVEPRGFLSAAELARGSCAPHIPVRATPGGCVLRIEPVR